MGCSPSSRTNADNSRRESTDSELDALVRQVLTAPPHVQIDIGPGISHTPDFMHTVIFIFGGPGSQKGVLMQELAQEFDFVTITVEDIVFSYLPTKVANTVKNTVEMQELLKRDSAVLTLEWILNMISAKLSTSTSQRFLIDIVPELTGGFRRHPIFFAMELFISDEKLLMDQKQNGGSADEETKAIDTKDLSPELSAFIKGIDEADKGRLERRLEAYHSCSLPFIRYFQKTKRVIKFDLKVPHNPDLTPSVRKILMDFGFARNNDTIRVVLFVTSERQVGDIDLSYYRLRKVRLSDVCHDRDETLSQQIRTVRKFIYTTAQPNENFFVILNCLNNTDYPPIKRINFLEYKTTYLDFFIRYREKRNPTVRYAPPTPLDGILRGGKKSSGLELPGTSTKVIPTNSLIPSSTKATRSRSEEVLRPRKVSTTLPVNVRSILKQSTSANNFTHYGPIPGGLLTPENTIVLGHSRKVEPNDSKVPIIVVNESFMKKAL